MVFVFFKKRLEFIFLGIVLIAIFVLVRNYHNDYLFKHSDIPDSYKQMIVNEEQKILKLMKSKYGVSYKVPLIVTSSLKNNLYGITSYENGKVKIFLNKNVMQESIEYIIKSVLPHEYAHALLFKLNHHLVLQNDGHSREWQKACIDLGGINCEQYVNQTDIVMGKLPF